jgi:beta-N-acetylhexosaminidase
VRRARRSMPKNLAGVSLPNANPFVDRPLPLAAVFSVEGEALTHAEKTLFSAAQPFGFILFGRNCKTPAQLKALTEELRGAVGWNCPVLIDQEGGRVARLKAPHWPEFPSARHYGQAIEGNEEKARETLSEDMRGMARMLRENGLDVNCAPVMDVLTSVTHTVIGDRAFSNRPDIVVEAASLVCQAFLSEGVFPVIKHLPGHGRAAVDSHHQLPVVTETADQLADSDFLPFREICQKPFAAGLWGMAAHVIYSKIDPEHPASVSEIVINKIIRGMIGFDGLLFSDDLDMKALENYGPIEQRARESLQAGCDLALYCWAKLDVMEKMAAQLPPLSAEGWRRWMASLETMQEMK